MTLVKAFGILVEARGRGTTSGDPVIGTSGDRKTKTRIRGVVATGGAYLLSAVSSLSETVYFPPSSTVSAWP
jgi:hypothetical protein